jgi:chloride channel 7
MPAAEGAREPLHEAAQHGHSAHHEHHAHGPLDKVKAEKVKSLCFEPVFNEKFNADRSTDAGPRFETVVFILPLLIGLATAAAAVVVGLVSEKLGDLRTNTVQKLVVEQGFVVAWMAEASLMTVMALVAGLAVYAGDSTKTAGSSGIPQLIGLLNGCDLQAQFGWKHMLTKWFGVSLAVASGLAVGPEGPMIFIGSSVGFLLSRLLVHPEVWKLLGKPPRTVPDDVFTRDYTSIGAACGIAAAFRAPIAGTLFIVEEAASHFRKDMLSNIFMGGLASLEVILLNGGAGAILEYKVQTGPGCSSTPWWSIFFCVVIGIVCGVAGALFNTVNVAVMTWRANHCNPGSQWPGTRRAVEIIVLCLLTSLFWVAPPMWFPEQPATSQAVFAQSDGCLKDNYKNQVIMGSVIERDSDGAYLNKFIPAPCLYGIQYNPDLCPQAFAAASSSSYAQTCVGFVQASSIRERSDYQNYCCNFTSLPELMQGNFQDPDHAQCEVDLGESVPSLKNGEPTYNSMAALTLVPFKTACQNLFARGVPHLISWEAMLLFLILFFTAAAITAGSAIPSGLLMPQMVIGGLIGRLGAILAIKIQMAIHLTESEGTSMWSSLYAPFFSDAGGPLPAQTLLTPDTAGYLDPGIAAIVGAAAFLGGSGRVTLFTTVMMVEITGDPIMIFPVGFATIFAVIVGNKINHGLYHALIDVQSAPYLPDTWQGQGLPSWFQALEVEDMAPNTNPIVVRYKEGREAAQKAIDEVPKRVEFVKELKKKNPKTRELTEDMITHFPVVEIIEKPQTKQEEESGIIVGMVEKEKLKKLEREWADKGGPLLERYPSGATSLADQYSEDIKYISDLHPLTIRSKYPLQMAYQLFKSMDMKNLVVVDDHHVPQAVMTRLAFLAWRVEERLTDDVKKKRKDQEIARVQSARSQRRLSSSAGSANVSMQPQQRRPDVEAGGQQQD